MALLEDHRLLSPPVSPALNDPLLSTNRRRLLRMRLGRLLALVILFFGGRPVIWAEDPVPQALPKGRYDQLREHSPFSLATVVAPPAGPQNSFADNWYVSGLARVGDDDFVTIKSRDLSTQFSLFGHETDAKTGVTLASVNWSDAIGKSTVILKKGNETAKLEFNEAEIHAAPQSPNGKPNPNGNATPAKTMAGGPRPSIQPGGQPGQPFPAPAPNANPLLGQPGQFATPPVHRRAQVIVPPQ
jgi:hypothetical protein